MWRTDGTAAGTTLAADLITYPQTLVNVRVREKKALADVPAIAETLPGYEASLFNAMVAPAATPKAIIARMHAEIAKIVQRLDLRTRFAQLGTDLAASASPEEFTAFMKSDYAKWARVIRDAGIRAE